MGDPTQPDTTVISQPNAPVMPPLGALVQPGPQAASLSEDAGQSQRLAQNDIDVAK